MDHRALFRVALADGQVRWAAGTPADGPTGLLAPETSLDRALGSDGPGIAEMFQAQPVEDVPTSATILAPVQSQEVWAAGVTYEMSRDAREEESAAESDCYRRVYDAERPELFFKAAGWRVRGPGESVGIRTDSAWDVPEPELTVVLDAQHQPVALTIGNDMSSRSIEGENPLYLPQAKCYEGACAIGPCLVPFDAVTVGDLEIRMTITREGAAVFEGTTSTSLLHRSVTDLAGYLARTLSHPVGAFLMTGTCLVPPDTVTLREGDVVAIGIDGLGTLSNPVATVGADAVRG